MAKILYKIQFHNGMKKFYLPENHKYNQLLEKVQLFSDSKNFTIYYNEKILTEQLLLNISKNENQSILLQVVRTEDQSLRADIDEFISFNDQISSPYQLVFMCEGYLKSSGFKRLKSEIQWDINIGQSYYIKNNKFSSLIAFYIPEKFDKEKLQFKIISSNVDFPCLRITTYSKNIKGNQMHINIQKYGESNWQMWNDRNLKLGGRVVYKQQEDIKLNVLNIDIPFGYLSSDFYNLEDNKLFPLVGILTSQDQKDEQHYNFLLELIAQTLNIETKQLVDFDLCLTPSEKTTVVGAENELISGPNLSATTGTWSALNSIIQSVDQKSISKNTIPLILLNNQYENHISRAKLESVLKRILRLILKSDDQLEQTQSILDKTFELRNMNCKSFNPFQKDQNQPKDKIGALNQGLTFPYSLKTNYPTNAVTRTILRKILDSQQLEYQYYLIGENKMDLKYLQNEQFWINGVDIGIPICSKNSSRELIGLKDLINLSDFMSMFLSEELVEIQDDFLAQ